MTSSGELQEVRSEIDTVKEEIKDTPDLAERTAVRKQLLILEKRVNLLLKGEEAWVHG